MTEEAIQAYPLAWPEGWPRASSRRDGSFGKRDVQHNGWTGLRDWTMQEALVALQSELDRLEATEVVLSSNYQRRLDGSFVLNKGGPADPGVALYFKRKGKRLAMAQDAFHRPADNVRSLTLALEAIRAIERHGGGPMMDRVFTGFAALPPPADHWKTLGLKPGASEDEVQAAYRARAKDLHPDQRGGVGTGMADLNVARDKALREIREGARP